MVSYKKIILIAGILLFFAVPKAYAASVGDLQNFNVDRNFDVNARTQVSATLLKVSSNLYFYVDKSWWGEQTLAKQNAVLSNLDNLSSEFDGNIYPKLTSFFGSEWNPGIDRDNKITVLLEPMNSAEGGYFREVDEYEKVQMPTSNEREMVYLATLNADNIKVKNILAHEFTHLIEFNQKNKNFGTEEDTWLNEARADYSSTILGYDDVYVGSNLQQRVNDFIENSSDSLTDWNGTKYDYASISLFMHYLTDHYGANILSDSLKSKTVGIESLNSALLRKGVTENFSQIFANWTIASVVNDCSKNSEYCYSNVNLKNIRVNPTLIFLPLTGSSSLSSTNVTKDWAGNWQKIIGGSGNLKLSFNISAGLKFQVPYIIYDKDNNYSVNFLAFDKDGRAEISISDFGTKYKSLIIIPISQLNSFGSDGPGATHSYSFTVSVAGNDLQEDPVLIQKLLAQIQDLKKQIADILAQSQSSTTCSSLNSNLYLGMTSNGDVKCLQGFLKNQGASIYPEGLVTGNFGSLTKNAVVKFQAKYNIAQTGFVGEITRAKINQILNGN
jgi:hypothetical protein